MTPRFRPRAVVFDLDGTLVDSLPLVLAAIGHAIAPYGRRPEKDIFASLGGPPARFLGALLPDLAHLPTALDRMEQYHRENAHLIQPFAGATQILGALQAQVQLALWTGRDRVSTEWILNEHRLESFFATAVCGDDLATHKPDPAATRCAAGGYTLCGRCRCGCRRGRRQRSEDAPHSEWPTGGTANFGAGLDGGGLAQGSPGTHAGLFGVSNGIDARDPAAEIFRLPPTAGGA